MATNTTKRIPAFFSKLIQTINRINPKIKFILVLLATFLVIFLLWFIFVPKNLVFIFDNSGSMAGDFEREDGSKTTYQEFAKETIKKTITQPRLALTKVGLVQVGGQCIAYDKNKNKGISEEDYNSQLSKNRDKYAPFKAQLSTDRKDFNTALEEIPLSDSNSTPLGIGIRQAAESLPPKRLISIPVYEFTTS